MSLTQNLEELLYSLERLKPAKKFSIVVMPDFFSDRLVTYEGDIKHFSKAMTEVAERKGGSIHGIKQLELRGKRSQHRLSLSPLGAKVYPIINTSL